MMNSDDIRSLYDYAIASRRRFLEKSREVGWDEFVKNNEASWNSMQGIFIHVLEVEDSWLHYDMQGKQWPYGDRDPNAFKSFDEVEAYEREVTDRTMKFLDNITNSQLTRTIAFDYRSRMVESSIENILIHTFIDEIAHIGELICLMWQMDVKPPYENWIGLHLNSDRKSN